MSVSCAHIWRIYDVENQKGVQYELSGNGENCYCITLKLEQQFCGAYTISYILHYIYMKMMRMMEKHRETNKVFLAYLVYLSHTIYLRVCRHYLPAYTLHQCNNNFFYKARALWACIVNFLFWFITSQPYSDMLLTLYDIY